MILCGRMSLRGMVVWVMVCLGDGVVWGGMIVTQKHGCVGDGV